MTRPSWEVRERMSRTLKDSSCSSVEWDLRVNAGVTRLIVPFALPSMNEWMRWHWRKRHGFLGELRQGVYFSLQKWINAHVMTYGVCDWKMPRRVSVRVTHFFRTRRRRDLDNLTPKFLLDAMKGVLFEDDWMDLCYLETPVVIEKSLVWGQTICDVTDLDFDLGAYLKGEEGN